MLDAAERLNHFKFTNKQPQMKTINSKQNRIQKKIADVFRSLADTHTYTYTQST